jgi:ribosome-associated protein
MGVQLVRCALPFGDYAVIPEISVDTKNSMNEIASNLTADHERFRHECERAKEAGCILYVLVETEWNINSIDDVHLWKNPRSPLSQRAVSGELLEKIMKTMERRYGVRFRFCRPDKSAETIIKILSGEIK